MLDISFEINGKEVKPDDMEEALDAEILAGVEENIRQAIGLLRCSEHGESPKIRVTGNGLSDLSVDISGCCERLISQVEDTLK